MTTIVKQLDFSQSEIKFDKSKTGVFEGYASVFDVLDSDGDRMLKGCFSGVLKNQTRTTAMFFNHNSRMIPVGKWLEKKEDEKGLYVVGELTPNHSIASDLKASMLHGTVSGLSIGFSAKREDFTVTDTGRDFKNIQFLPEISICTMPANEEAGILSIKSMDGIETIRDIENWLRESAQFSKSEAQMFISRFKSIALRESDEEQKTREILSQIQNFNLKGN